MPQKQRTVVIDPELMMKRMLHYRERHSAWHIFQSVYWAIYFFVVGFLFMVQSAAYYPVGFTLGAALIIFAVMLVIYGFAMALHSKFMKAYG